MNKEWLVVLGLMVCFLAGIVTGISVERDLQVCESVQGAPLLAAPAERMVEGSRTVEVNKPVAVTLSEKREVTWMYRLDEFGHAIWRQAGEIPAGVLVKRGSCLADGYAQVEYPDPGRPNWWRVQFVKCEVK